MPKIQFSLIEQIFECLKSGFYSVGLFIVFKLCTFDQTRRLISKTMDFSVSLEICHLSECKQKQWAYLQVGQPERLLQTLFCLTHVPGTVLCASS